MSKNESQSQKLNEIFKNISNILAIDNNNSKENIKKLLNNYLTSIINNKKEFNNFFTSLNSFIFSSKSEEINESIQKDTKFNKDLFVIYPIIYSFNQKITINYIDHFLNTLKQAVKDQNQSDFSFLSLIFADIINCFFNNKDNNSYCIDNKQKEILYKKIFSYINIIMKTNENITQSFGCLLLSEFIEKCPLVKDKNNLGPLFKEVSLYLEDNKFECKIDLLNCIITLILTVEKKFKSYVNVCLFRILDYLTDNDWIKRKLAINIVYIMTFYCKEEIMVVKDNIIEFLNILKEDNVTEIREVCLETLKIIDGKNTKDINKIIKYLDLSEEKKSNILNKSHQEQSEMEKKHIIKNTDLKIKNRIDDNISENIKNLKIKKIESYENGINFFDLNKGKTKNKINNNNSLQSNKKIKNVINEQIKKGTTSTNSLKISSKTNKKQNNRNKINFSINNIIENYMNINLNTSYSITNNTELSERKINPRLNKSTEQRTTNNLNKRNIKKDNSKNVKKKDTNQELLEQFQKEKLIFQEIEKQINDKKPKKSALPSSTNEKMKSNHKSNNSKNMEIKKITDILTKKEQENSNTQKNEENDNEIKYNESIDITSINNVTDTNININVSEKKDEISIMNNNDENYSESNTNKILEQFNIIQDKQNKIIKMINNLKDTVDMNYMILNKRINTLEKYIINFNILNNSNEDNQLDDEMEIETIKKKYISGKYNEALTEAKQNDKYIYKLLPLISAEKIPNIDISIIDDIIFILCIKLPTIQVGQKNIHSIISFLNQIIRSKISLKSYIKNKIKDTLKFMKIENNLKLSQSDIVNIDNILKAIEL